MEKDKNLMQALSMELMSEQGEELIPLLSPEEEENLGVEDIPSELPILTVKNTVLYPGVVIPITVGRKKSVELIKDAYSGDKTVGVLTQLDAKVEDPAPNDLYKVGTVAKIVKMLVLPDGNTTVIIQGKKRFEVARFTQVTPYIKAEVNALNENFDELEENESETIVGLLKDSAKKIVDLNPELPQEAQVALDNIKTIGFLIHFLSSNINASIEDKQALLSINDGRDRAKKLLEFLTKEIQLLEIKREIQSKAHTDIDAQQRDYYLRQQMKVLQEELGDGGIEKDYEQLKAKIEMLDLPTTVKEHLDRELVRFSRLNPMAADYPVTLNYLEYVVELPWNEYSKDNFNLKNAKKILDKDHYGMDKVKDRILEYLAVLKLKSITSNEEFPSIKGPILCLYGPPGVGKTSLGKSIAKALNREYIRVSLGGLHDEAEIRGHRKTYIGSMPGKVIQNIKKAGANNPVFVLDEIDKIGSDFKGDPSSALLEVLDPEQNQNFVDNYLEVEYDLSKVLFVATSNSLDTIQPALRDRMEIIELTGYTLEEKAEIAKRHLIPKLIKENGLDPKAVTISKPAIIKVIDYYTRESGVRGLSRQLGKLIRQTAKAIAMEEEYPNPIKPVHVEKYLGPELVDKESYENNDLAGVVTGLAWTSVGGEILNIESVLSRGKGKLTLSGQLGDVMKESAMAALTNLKSIASRVGIDYKVFDNFDLHIHVPAGAVPKDGPSAGITMLTSLASVFSQRKVKKKLAMTGEITLTGKVLPVGGIKEKILAAKRAGIQEIIMCHKNEKDIIDIEPHYIKGLTIHYVKTSLEVLKIALLNEKVKNPVDLTIIEKGKV